MAFWIKIITAESYNNYSVMSIAAWGLLIITKLKTAFLKIQHSDKLMGTHIVLAIIRTYVNVHIQ